MKAWIVQQFRLTKAEYFVDFCITPPLTIILAAITVCRTPFIFWAPEMILGFIAWTAYEYGLHRWGLHGLPILKEIHAMHHRRQTDYIAVPPWATLLIYSTSVLVFGVNASGWVVGFSLGYVAYSLVHTLCHYAPLHGLMSDTERRHDIHHRFANRNFGVTTSFWDRLFGTEAPYIT